MSTIQRETTPLEDEDLFIVLNHPDAEFDYPVHYHPDFELNLVLNTSGKRIIGDSIETFENVDLVLTGPNVPHKWEGIDVKGNHVITIQFPDKLLSFPILQKRLFSSIKEMLEKSSRGIRFDVTEQSEVIKRIMSLTQMSGFPTCLEFLSLLHDLSVYPHQRMLTSSSFDSESIVRESKSRRIAKIHEYIGSHYMNPIKLEDIAALVSMSPSALSHFFKKRTSRNIVDYINDLRIHQATKMLIDTTDSVSEIAFACGFNNLSNFNRTFRRIRGNTPTEYRESIKKIMIKY